MFGWKEGFLGDLCMEFSNSGSEKLYIRKIHILAWGRVALKLLTNYTKIHAQGCKQSLSGS